MQAILSFPSGLGRAGLGWADSSLVGEKVKRRDEDILQQVQHVLVKDRVRRPRKEERKREEEERLENPLQLNPTMCIEVCVYVCVCERDRKKREERQVQGWGGKDQTGRGRRGGGKRWSRVEKAYKTWPRNLPEDEAETGTSFSSSSLSVRPA